MRSQFMANVKTNWIFYRRNKLLIAFGIIMLSIFALMVFTSAMFMGEGKRFEIIKLSIEQLSGWIIVMTAAFGILSISHHRRSRNLKMVMTKPCPPEMWILSQFVSALSISFISFVCVGAAASLLFAVWDIPFQWGMLAVLLKGFLHSVIVFSYIAFLSFIFHPAVTIAIVYLFQENMFYWLLTYSMAWSKSAANEVLINCLTYFESLLYVVYMALPGFDPYKEKVSSLSGSFRLSPGEVQYLMATISYAVVVFLFFYFLSCYFLKRKRHF